MIRREVERCTKGRGVGSASHKAAHPKHSEGERWRWGAYQVLLYGSECYEWLSSGHRQHLHFLRCEEAATSLQRRYRGRLAMRFAQLPTRMVKKLKAEQVARVAQPLPPRSSEIG